MKKSFFVLTLLFAFNFFYGQSVLDLGFGSQVRNSVVFDNPGGIAVSSGVSVSFSASDSVLTGGFDNVHLLNSPFLPGLRIDAGSALFDMGNRYYLGVLDTLDLDNNRRLSCRNVDIGAFEYLSVPAVITVQPFLSGRVCGGEAVELIVEAVGDGLSFQWQLDGVDIDGAVDSILLIPSVSMLDTGYYRVVVRGTCSSDTSALVRLDVDPRPWVVAMNDTTISLGQDVVLYVLEYSGSVSWLAGDSLTVLSNLHLTNLSESSRFFAVASSGVCSDTSSVVYITVKDELIVSLESWDGCFIGDGWAEVGTVSGTGPFSYLWSTGSTNRVVEGLNPGTHSVTVTDAHGISGTASVVIYPVVPLDISFRVDPADNEDCSNGSIFVEVSGGTGPFYFNWSSLWDGEFERFSQHLLNVPYGMYRVLATDSRGCTADAEIPLACTYARVMATMLLTPNDDGLNDFVYIRNIELFPNNRVVIISSYGEEIITIYNYDNIDRVWRGHNSRGDLVADGTYYYIVEAEGMRAVAGWIIVRLSGR